MTSNTAVNVELIYLHLTNEESLSRKCRAMNHYNVNVHDIPQITVTMSRTRLISSYCVFILHNAFFPLLKPTILNILINK